MSPKTIPIALVGIISLHCSLGAAQSRDEFSASIRNESAASAKKLVLAQRIAFLSLGMKQYDDSAKAEIAKFQSGQTTSAACYANLLTLESDQTRLLKSFLAEQKNVTALGLSETLHYDSLLTKAQSSVTSISAKKEFCALGRSVNPHRPTKLADSVQSQNHAKPEYCNQFSRSKRSDLMGLQNDFHRASISGDIKGLSLAIDKGLMLKRSASSLSRICNQNSSHLVGDVELVVDSMQKQFLDMDQDQLLQKACRQLQRVKSLKAAVVCSNIEWTPQLAEQVHDALTSRNVRGVQ